MTAIYKMSVDEMTANKMTCCTKSLATNLIFYNLSVIGKRYFCQNISGACTINIYDRRFYDRNDIGLNYNTL